MIRFTEEQRQELTEMPVRGVDPVTNTQYVVIPADLYDRLKPIFEDDPPSRKERLEQLRQFGLRAGWDDPEMDVYNDLPSRP